MIADQFSEFVTMVMARFDEAYRAGVSDGIGTAIVDVPFPGLIKLWRNGRALATIGGNPDTFLANGPEIATLATRVMGADSVAMALQVSAVQQGEATDTEGLMMHIFTRGGDGWRTVRLYRRTPEKLTWLSSEEQVAMLSPNWGWETRPDQDSPFKVLMDGGYRLGPALKPHELDVGVNTRAQADLWGMRMFHSMMGERGLVALHVTSQEYRDEIDKLRFGDYLQEN